MANHRHSNTQARLGNRRILVVLNGIVEAEAFRRATGLGRRDEQQAEVRVIAPALNSRIRHWLSDEDEARRRAHLRLAATLESLCAAGIEADGRVGDADPLQAIDDALGEFHPEEIVIVTQPDRHSHWTTRDLSGQARRRFAQAVVQIVAESEENARAALASRTRRPALAAFLACTGIEADA
jgi:GABA permease